MVNRLVTITLPVRGLRTVFTVAFHVVSSDFDYFLEITILFSLKFRSFSINFNFWVFTFCVFYYFRLFLCGNLGLYYLKISNLRVKLRIITVYIKMSAFWPCDVWFLWRHPFSKSLTVFVAISTLYMLKYREVLSRNVNVLSWNINFPF